MGALFAKWDSLNGDLYFQDYICIQLQMMWRGEAKGSRFNTRPLSMNNSIIWIKWTPGAVGKALRRAVDPLTLPTSLFPSLSLSVSLSLQFHSTLYKMPYTCNFSLPSAKNLLSREAKAWKKMSERWEGQKLLSIFLHLGKVIWKRGVMFHGNPSIKYCKKKTNQYPGTTHCWY